MTTKGTKYIITDNVKSQSINGNLYVNGILKSNNTGVYRALLTQTGAITASNINDFNSGLIIGETYTIVSYFEGDDFSNIAEIVSGEINKTNCVFVATGQVPINWQSSTLTSQGGLIVDVLENTLGYNLDWSWAPFEGNGYYVAINHITGPVYNAFQRDKVEIITPLKYPFGASNTLPPFITPSIISFEGKDSLIVIDVINVSGGPGGPSDDLLYYTPIEIKINQDLDIEPIIVRGKINLQFPFSNPYIRLMSNRVDIQDIYLNQNPTVTNISELITVLNDDVNNVYGFVFSEDVDKGIKVTMPKNIKNQFCPNGTLTFEIDSK